MSYNEKIKAIRLPIPEYLFGKNGQYYDGYSEYGSACNYFETKFSDLFYDVVKRNIENHFIIHTTQKSGCYIDYILEYENPVNEKYYSIAYNLNEEETEKYKQIFNHLNFKYNVEDLRKVEYCYYNGVDAPDCYKVKEPITPNSITIVYPAYHDSKKNIDIKLLGQGVAFTDNIKAMQFQNFMDKNAKSKWNGISDYVFWDNQIIILDPDKEEWQKKCNRWNRRMEEE